MIKLRVPPAVLALAVFTILLSSSAKAACTGSGTSWNCASGSTSSQIQSAIDSASDGATITFANGSYSISGVSLNSRNGITLICTSVGGCTITPNADIFSIDSCGAGKTNLMRVSGFNFAGDAGTAKIWFFCNSDLKQVRIDHNDFTQGASQISILFGEVSSSGHVYGVVDHNTFHATTNFMAMKNISGGTAWVTGLQGSANNLFFEDNTLTFSNYSDLGTGGVDVWRANGTVIRFNRFTNARIVNHSYCHEGPTNSEIYGNIINAPNSVAPQYRNVHFQGSGEEIAFGNTVEDGGNAIVVQHFRGDPDTATNEGNCNSLSNGTVTGTGADSQHANDGNRSPVGTYGGYPSWHQPGRNGAGVMKPVYAFMNKTASGNRVDLIINGCDTGSSCYIPKEFRQNRDFYNGVSASPQTSPTSPFTGSAGVGFGVLARRPATCTPTSETLDAGNGGVAYWATDQGSWNSSGNGFGSGVLYRCSATNTWVAHYTPYTYPHPLQSGSDSGPNAPTNLQAVPH